MLGNKNKREKHRLIINSCYIECMIKILSSFCVNLVFPFILSIVDLI